MSVEIYRVDHETRNIRIVFRSRVAAASIPPRLSAAVLISTFLKTGEEFVSRDLENQHITPDFNRIPSIWRPVLIRRSLTDPLELKTEASALLPLPPDSFKES
ncbi:hypothetical protein RRG08_047293 [Elysia crispata]|uniref:Uncharacterized protein n=1 Tax=Elysia crispata TaxID=231223 RepID=A0AAE1DEB6_9GAST|nr:hypothetical protein RRG08_047293 [Elysia crispata]